MRCEDFRYSEEKIDTGIEDIDAVEEENAYTIKLNLATSGDGNFQHDEVVYQSTDGTWANNTAYAHVSQWYKANGMMLVFDVVGSFANGSSLYGNTSGAVFNTVSIDDESDPNKYDLSDNEYFNSDTTLILDLSELNPFGVP